MKNARRTWMTLIGLSAGLLQSAYSVAQVSNCCDSAIASPTNYVSSTRTTVMRPIITVESPVVYQATSYNSFVRPRRNLLAELFQPRYRETTYVETSYVPPSYEVFEPTVYTTTYLPTKMVEVPVVMDVPVETVYTPTRYSVVEPCDSLTETSSVAVPRASSQSLEPTSTRAQSVGSSQSLSSPAAPPKAVRSRQSPSSESMKSSPNAVLDSANPPPATLKEPSYDEFPVNPRPEKIETDGLMPAPAGVTGPVDEDVSRTAFKPRATDLSKKEVSASGLLRGQVITGSSGAAQPNVRVVFSDQRNTFKDRVKNTDATGRFELVLPNGDWTVNVIEPDGNQTSYGTITSTSGRFLDENDRVISSIRINH